MKQIQRLFASLVLVCALALTAPAGIIQTGTPPPPPTSTSPTTPAEEEMTDETAEGETPVLEAAAAAALDFMCDLLTIF